MNVKRIFTLAVVLSLALVAAVGLTTQSDHFLSAAGGEPSNITFDPNGRTYEVEGVPSTEYLKAYRENGRLYIPGNAFEWGAKHGPSPRRGWSSEGGA